MVFLDRDSTASGSFKAFVSAEFGSFFNWPDKLAGKTIEMVWNSNDAEPQPKG
jgi:hypothetical protein